MDERRSLVIKLKLINVKDDRRRIINTLLYSKIDNKILKYIKSITVHDKESVSEKDGKKVLGLATIHYNNNEIDYGTIDIVSSKFHPGLEPEKEFINTLNHEIAHIGYATISDVFGSNEELACDYANKQEMVDSKNTIISYIFFTIIILSIYIVFLNR